MGVFYLFQETYMKKNLKNPEKTAWEIFSKYIRLRDAIKTTGDIYFFRCCTCQRVKPFENSDAGHYMSIGYNSTKFDEKNVHSQCRACNRDRNGEHNAYRYFLQKQYGENFVQTLEYKAKKIVQLRENDYLEIIEKYKKKIILLTK